MTPLKIDIKPKEKRRTTVSTFLTKAEQASLAQYATEKGVNISQLMRTLLHNLLPDKIEKP